MPGFLLGLPHFLQDLRPPWMLGSRSWPGPGSGLMGRQAGLVRLQAVAGERPGSVSGPRVPPGNVLLSWEGSRTERGSLAAQGTLGWGPAAPGPEARWAIVPCVAQDYTGAAGSRFGLGLTSAPYLGSRESGNIEGLNASPNSSFSDRRGGRDPGEAPARLYLVLPHVDVLCETGPTFPLGLSSGRPVSSDTL